LIVAEDNALSLKLKSRSSGAAKFDDVNEVFGLSDSDDDFIDSHNKKKKNKKEKELGEGDFFCRHFCCRHNSGFSCTFLS
jgi:hypothetical protein